MKSALKIFTTLIFAATLFVGCNKSDDDNGSPAVDLTVTTLSPTAGEAGTVVTITGSGFDATASNNTVRFNGTTATVNSANETELQVTVPAGATTGAVSVSVDETTAEGPIFTYDERLKFEGEYENDDYQLRVFKAGELDTIFNINKTAEIRVESISDSDDEIELDLTDFLEDSINESLAGGIAAFSFSIDDVVATVDGDEFEIEDLNFTVSGNSQTFQASFDEGEGVLEDGEIEFSFQYSIIDIDGIPVVFSAEEVILELQ